MNQFKKYYEDNIFKPATPKEVEERYSLTDPEDIFTNILNNEDVAMAVSNLSNAVQMAVNNNVKGDKIMSREERLDALMNLVGKVMRSTDTDDISPELAVLYGGEIE